MAKSFLRRWFLIAVAFPIFPCEFTADSLMAQSTNSSKTDVQPVVKEKAIPLAVLCAAGVERWLNTVDYVFEAIKRDELSDFVGGQMSKVNDLKGVDRDKPFGMLIFLKPGLLPQPYPVSFVPIKNLGEMIGTLTTGVTTVKKIDETHYDIVTDNNTIHAKLAGEYAWLAQETDQLDYEFPNPADLTARLTKRYDAAFEFNLTSVPEAIKLIFLDFLRASTETATQQRDGEPDGAYQLRRVNALNTVDFIEQLILQGERLTFGLSVDQKTKHATIEADVVAKSDSDFSRLLQDMASRPSYFNNVLRDDVPLTFSMSTMLTPSNQKRMAEFFDVAEQEATTQLANLISGEKKPELPKPEPVEPQLTPTSGKPKRGSSAKPKKPKQPVPPSVRDVFDSLRATSLAGHVDFFVQFLAEESADKKPQFTFLGGGKVADGSKLAGGLSEILRQIKGRPQLAALDLNIDEHKGVTFHRIRGSEIRRTDEIMYGDKPALYVGLSSQAIWFAIGQPSALDQLKLVIDKVQAGAPQRPGAESRVAIQFTVHAKRWLEFGESNQDEFRRVAEGAREKSEAKDRAVAEAAGAKPTEAAPANNDKPNAGDNSGRPRGQRRGLFGGGPLNRPDPNAGPSIPKQAFSGDDDMVRIDVRPTDLGGRLKFEFDEGFVRLVGLGVSSQIDAANKREKERQEKKKEAEAKN